MREHIYEIEYKDIKRCVESFELTDDTLAVIRLIDFEVTECIMSAETVYLRLQQVTFVEVLALLGILIHPHVRIHLLYLQRHEAGKDSVAGILGSSR